MSNKNQSISYSHLQDEFKSYHRHKQILKNDLPRKYWALNCDLFINLAFWVWVLWQIWAIVAIVAPFNSRRLVAPNSITPLFNSAFVYVYKSISSSGSNTTTNISHTQWHQEAYIFIALTFALVCFSIYKVGLVQNFLYDIKKISIKHKVITLTQKCNNLKILLFGTFALVLFTVGITFLSLLYVPALEPGGVASGATFVTSLLFLPNKAHQQDSYFLPLSNYGTAILWLNILVSLLVFRLYYLYLCEKNINNNFYFKEGRSYSPPKHKKDLKLFLAETKKKSKTAKKGVDFVKPNTQGYIAELTDINKVYFVDGKPFYALKDINLKIKKGEFIVILGPSGSGKTTLLNILSAIDIPSEGDIVLSNHDTKKMNDSNLDEFRRKKISYVFQHYALLSNLTAKENVDMVAYLNKDDSRKSKFKELKLELKKNAHYKARALAIKNFLKHIFIDPSDNQEVMNLLNILNLGEHAHKYPHQLSGGQQQRVAIARSLIKRPEILFGDETTGALDHMTAKTILELFYLINKHAKTTVIMITHNPVIAEIADRVLHVSEGRIAQDYINAHPKKISDLKNL